MKTVGIAWVALVLLSAAAPAQEYPIKAVRLVVPYPAGSSSNDIIAPREVGEYVHAKLQRSEFRMLEATGHCPNLSAPDEVTAAIREFV